MSTLEEFLSAALLVPLGDEPDLHPLQDPTTIWGVPMNLIGLSGIGKSSRLKAIGKAVGLPVHVVFAPTKMQEDFAGVYVQTPNGVIVDCVLPAAKKCIDQGGGLIVLDEISCATNSTQKPLLSFVNDRRVGDYVLPGRTRILTAMNPTEYATGGNPISGALANRMGHRKMPPPNNSDWGRWITGMKPNVIPVEQGEAIVCREWGNHWPIVAGLASGFAERVSSTTLHNQPKPDDPASEGAWPSPRMWYWAMRSIAAVRCLGMSKELEQEFVEALVGEGCAVEWMEWVAEADLPHPMEMLTKGWSPNKQRLDINIAALSAMTNYVRARPTREEQVRLATPAWHLLKKTMEANLSDQVVNQAQLLLRSQLARHNTNTECQAISEQVIYDLTNQGHTQFATA